jgi:RHS repeat-associated protein
MTGTPLPETTGLPGGASWPSPANGGVDLGFENSGSATGTDPSPALPVISTPKGGGAIKGIGEKFGTNPVSGTATMSVPVQLSPGRSGFGPSLSLSYDSGNGNGVWGLGWALNTPAIRRKTDKGLPRYADANESDVFLISGAEDLVPVLNADCTRHADTTTFPGFEVYRYRPRIEGLFARIERWVDTATGETHWRSISRDNVTTLYGRTSESRIEDGSRTFEWLICESSDDRGNAIVYEYVPEDDRGVDPPLAGSSIRDHARQRYLKRIHYGNQTSRLVSDDAHDWMFEVVFDYTEGHLNHRPPAAAVSLGEQHRYADASTDAAVPWPVRPDPFSAGRAGFEVRTHRRCTGILMFHRIPDLGPDPYLVRSTEFDYRDLTDYGQVLPEEEMAHEGSTRIASFLMAVTQSGYRRQQDGGYLCRGLPPVEFRYSKPVIDQTVHTLDDESLRNLPIGLDGQVYQWVDLDGVGVPGVLSAQNGTWYWKANLGSGRLGPTAPLREAPAAVTPGTGRGQLLDLQGDGRLDAAVLDGPSPGFSSRTDDGGWTPYRTLRAVPAVRHGDPNLRFVDLTGDGLADILVTEADAFTWYPSLGEDGFAGGQRVPQPDDAGAGPRLVFADGEQAVYLADMTGDGLVDMVRIRNGQVAFWPSLGRGRFGSRVVLRNSPWFDRPEAFDQRRIRLADVDGSNTTDIIYLGRDGARLYSNQSGNRLSDTVQLRALPPVNQFSAVQVADLLGNGTACLVWSSPMPADARTALRYVDLMGGVKPHLLVSVVNNLGSETTVQYTPSTRFYLDDLAAGRPWATRLPFPVHCVSRVETIDRLSGNRFVSRYRYAHGYFDRFEREFRGFGMVEQWDTEEIAALTDGNVPADNIAPESNIPPVHTKTWFHTGVYLGRDHISDYFAGLLNADDTGEYFREPGLTDVEARDLLLPDTILPGELTLEEAREACRALKGSMLRQEVYADDAGPGATAEQVRRARTPYTVTEQNLTIRTVQSRGGNRHAVFFTHAHEAINYHYERNPADPRIQHALTLEVDAYGNVLKQAAISYGRRKQIRVIDGQGNVQQVPNPGLTGLEPTDQAKQTTPLITYTENAVTNAIETSNTYRTPLPCEALTFELTGYTPTGGAGRFQASDLLEPDPATTGRLRHKFTDQVSYEAAATDNPCRRPIEWLRTLYRRDDLDGLLPLGQLHSRTLPGETYKLALTPGLVTQVFQRPHAGQPSELLLLAPESVLGGKDGNRGGYVQSQTIKAGGRFPLTDADDHWWIPSGQIFYTPSPGDSPATELTQARQHFFLPRRYRNPFDQDSFVDFDSSDLLPKETRDPSGNRVTVDANDYRVLQPRLVSDPNRNQTEVAFDTLGMVAGTALMGKPLPATVEGDTLADFVPDLTPTQLDAFFDADAPHSSAPDLLRGATTRIVYDLERYYRTRRAFPDDPAEWQPVCAATIGRETHVSSPVPPQGLKVQVGFAYSDGFGREIQKKVQAEPGPVDVNNPLAPLVNPRWVCSGWTVFNNKGRPVRQYEPFFSAAHDYEFGVMAGVSPVLFYDPVERVIASLHPNHTYAKVVFDPWQQTTYDVNDTCAPRNQQTGDPRTDPDIQGYVAEYFKTQPATWQTWHAQRIGGALGTHECDAAQRAAAHADTPTTAHFDALGRPFLTVARNRVACPGHALDGREDRIATRVELDIEGNQRAVRDERKLPVNHQPTGAIEQRLVIRYDYDMLGNRIHQLSMEAGARWTLNDVAGKTIRIWDSRGHNFITTYDALRRPVEQTVRGTTEKSDARTLDRDLLVDKIEYGEGIAGTEALNLRSRIYRHFDSAGVTTNARLDATGNPTEAYDFKGNLLHSTRRMVSDYKAIPDWLLSPQLDEENFEGSTRYDALNRPIQSIAPHGTLARSKHQVIQPVFNEANLLERVDVWLERAADPGALLDPSTEQPSSVGVANIDYDAKGQRVHISYKNGATTRYRYDPETFRLVQLYTRRGAAFTEDCDNPVPPPLAIPSPGSPPQGTSCGLQNLHYTCDPAGNITHIQDDAQQTIYFKNRRVEPSNDYIYDAIYRLIQATGREHLGQGGTPVPHSHNDAGRVGLLSADEAGHFAPNDGQAMGTYTERYVYDAVGNFLQMQHRGSDPAHPGWTRRYTYSEVNLIETGKQSNRLSSTQVGDGVAAAPETYQHDAHGNIVRMPHLGSAQPGPNMQWDYKDQLRETDLGGGGTASYLYDASGQRVRKVWEKAPGLTEERIYLGGFEIFRKHGGVPGANTVILERETLHIMGEKQRVAVAETRTLDTHGDDRAPRRLIRYQLGNHLGSASLELDEQAQIISYEEYAPYGSSTYQAVRSKTEATKRYRYTGKERDEESGFYYCDRRYYAAWLGRWLSADPAGMVDGPNLYRYVRGNPLAYTDPRGTDPQDQSQGINLNIDAKVNATAHFRLTNPLSLGPLRLTDINGTVAAQVKVSGLQARDIFSANRSFSVDSAVVGGTLEMRSDLKLPSFDMTGSGSSQLSLSRLSINHQFASAEIDAKAALSSGPVSLTLGVSGYGSTMLPPQIRPSEAAEQLSASMKEFRGWIGVSGRVDVKGLTVGAFSLSGDVGPGARGTLQVQGAFGLPSLDRGPSSVLGHVSGTGTFEGDQYNFSGSFRAAVPPVAFAAGTWSLDSTRGFGAQGHYFGPQLGRLGLNVGLNPTGSTGAEPTPMEASRSGSGAGGAVHMFEPGPSIGYTSFSYGTEGYRIFSAGVSPTSSSVPYYQGGVSQPFGGASLGPYAGFRFQSSF